MNRINVRDRVEIVERCARGENRTDIAQAINGKYLVSPNLTALMVTRVYITFKRSGTVFGSRERTVRRPRSRLLQTTATNRERILNLIRVNPHLSLTDIHKRTGKYGILNFVLVKLTYH